MYHSPHVQIPPSHHGHINASVENYRKPLLDCGKTKRGRKCIAIIVPLAVISAILSLGFKLLSGPGDLGHPASGADDFSPYTSLVFPISGLYCDIYRMTKYSGSSVDSLSWNTSMYILKTLPTLSTSYNFSIHTEVPSMITLKPGEFYQWSFILHGGSRYVINNCALGEGDDAKLVVIKGEALFSEWEVKRQCSGCVKYDLPPCNLNATEEGLVYDVLMDDEYYFVHFNPTPHHPAHVQIDMSFTKLEYSFDQDDIYCQCTCTSNHEYAEYYACSSCDLPLTFSGYLLLRTMPASDDIDINWEDKLYITWSCDASYNFAYLLLFCLPLMVIVVIVLVCSDIIMPCLSRCRRQNSDTNNAVADTEQPASLRCSRKVLFATLWFLFVLFISLVSVCIMVAGLTTLLTVIGFISKGIPTFVDSKLKLSLLALSIVLFIVSILCSKLKQWVQNKFRSVAKVMRLSRIGQNHQTRNTNDANTPALRSDIMGHLRNQILKVLCVCGVVPVVIVSIVCMSAMFTFLEAFFPVLSTYSSETDSGIFIPGDTQIFSFNSFFCSGYSISSYGSSHLSATLSIVNSGSVVGNHSVTYMISNDSVSANFSATRNYYLNEKSGANIRACLFEDDLRETTKLDLYEYDSFGPTPLHAYDVTDYSCHGDLWRLPIGKISGKAGKYQILLHTKSIDPVQVHVEIELNRFLYSVHQNVAVSSAQTCSVSSHTGDTCTAVAPSSAGSMIGIISAYSDQSPINWHETISITKTCHYHMATWTALWLPVLLINVAIFSVACGVIQIKKFKQIRKKLNQEGATGTDSEPLIPHEANGNNYGTNAVTATDSDSANASGQSDPEPAHEVVGVEVECTSDHNAITTEPSDPMGVVVQVEHSPTSIGDTSAGPMSEPGLTESALKCESSSAQASIRSISDSRDASEIVEHNNVDTMPIIGTKVEDTSVSYKP